MAVLVNVFLLSYNIMSCDIKFIKIDRVCNMHSNSKNCLQEEEQIIVNDIHDIFMMFMAI